VGFERSAGDSDHFEQRLELDHTDYHTHHHQPSTIITANWLAASDDRWTVPIGGGLGKLFRLGKLPVNTQLAAYSNVVKPRQGGTDWQLRFQVQFLFPK